MHIMIGGYRPGAIGRIAEMHAEYYHRNWGFGLFFEAKAATELAEFLDRFQKGAMASGRLSGDRVEVIAIDGLKAKPSQPLPLVHRLSGTQRQRLGPPSHHGGGRLRRPAGLPAHRAMDLRRPRCGPPPL